MAKDGKGKEIAMPGNWYFVTTQEVDEAIEKALEVERRHLFNAITKMLKTFDDRIKALEEKVKSLEEMGEKKRVK
jgi:hypothetical protein